VTVTVRHYFDYKSPYAWLAQADTFALAREPGVTVEWLPYTLRIEKYLGRAELDQSGADIIGTRNDHQWRRVRYAYMDCRREANRRRLVIRGPRRIFDSSLAHIGFLHVARQGDFTPYHMAVFERFWRRELDLEDAGALASVMAATGFDPGGFEAFAAGEGRALHDHIQREAEALGVFGVPSYVVAGELYWGSERLPRVREHLQRLATAPTPAAG
jgi:2-hydroxychromene-2-carboxylate isomerase